MPEFGQNLPLRRQRAIDTANTEIGYARKAWITSIPGQEMLYGAKEDEAKAWLALDPKPADYANFPLIEAEVGITAPTADELAQVWLNMGAMWRGVAAQLEALRLTAIAEIEAAATPADIQAALDKLAAGIAAT